VSNRFRPCMQILSPAQKLLWPELAAADKCGMVLYGGTAIALYLGHRTSFDFVFFSSNPLDKDALRKNFSFIKRSTVLQNAKDTYKVLVSYGKSNADQFRVSFFGAAGFGRVGEPSYTEDGVLQVASLNDLMATKVKFFLPRFEAKDYIDIAAMIKGGVDLAKGLASARRLYGKSFQPSECLKALCYFEGGDLGTLSAETKIILIKAASLVRDLPRVALKTHDLAVF
jgi:Nucleotidyl transferase AbiEii toxin, Type IV TA system